VTLDAITDAMALVGQHGVYCQSQRQLGKPAMDIQVVMKKLDRCEGTNSGRHRGVEDLRLEKLFVTLLGTFLYNHSQSNLLTQSDSVERLEFG